jgi:hypothetical protein
LREGVPFVAAILIRESEVVVSLSLFMLHSVPLLTVISKGVNEPAFSSAGE